MRANHARPRGIALVAVLFALVLLELLASAAFFFALKEMQSGQAALSVQRALATAEGMADSIVDSWNGTTLGGLGVGDSVVFRRSVRGGGLVQASVTRTGDGFFVVRTAAVFGPARQRVAVVLRRDRAPCANDTISCDSTYGYSGSGAVVRLGERGWIGAF